jgi:hypothetical protein
MAVNEKHGVYGTSAELLVTRSQRYNASQIHGKKELNVFIRTPNVSLLHN